MGQGGGVGVEGAALPLHSSLPSEVVRYDEGDGLYDYDDVDGGERGGGWGKYRARNNGPTWSL